MASYRCVSAFLDTTTRYFRVGAVVELIFEH